MKPDFKVHTGVPALSVTATCIVASVALAVAMGIGRFAFTPMLPLMVRDGALAQNGGAWLAASNYMGYLVGALSASRLGFSLPSRHGGVPFPATLWVDRWRCSLPAVRQHPLGTRADRTRDTCLLFATQAAASRGQPPLADASDPRLAAFSTALQDVLRDLAIQVAKDGEGRSKFVTFEICGAESFAAARRIALACANSPILKAAIGGGDPNWGRVLMAIGKAGEAADRDKLSIWFGPHIVAREGERAAEYVEQVVASYMTNREILIRADVGVGQANATVYTCDLTHDYTSINADYRS